METIPGMKKQIEKLTQEVSALNERNHALRTTAEKYKNIFMNLPVSVLIVDETGLVTEVNPFHVEHIGKGLTTASDYLNTYVAKRVSIVKAGLSEKYTGVLNGESLDEKEVHFPVTTGLIERYFNIKGTPIKDHDRITGAIFITEDVTDLRKAKEELINHKEKLEETVEARTNDLKIANENLKKENVTRKKAEEDKETLIAELQEALKKVKTLSGFIPICSSCKKIRDDKGFWNQLESYVKEHSDAEFTHGICPDCTKKLYGRFHRDDE